MRSPFPGMNPYLEQPDLWPEVHQRLIMEIADALDQLVSDRYRIAVERRVYMSGPDEGVLVGIPDVSVRRVAGNLSPSPVATLPQRVEPVSVDLLMPEEVRESYLEIRQGDRVITVIELLSPKNKRSGEGRTAYLLKRDRVLASQTHLIEIDWLRGGGVMPMSLSQSSHYRILVSRSHCRPKADLYPFSLPDPIPAIPIPLLDAEEPILDCQSLLQNVYRKGRYHLEIDYEAKPIPNFTPEEEMWANEVLRSYR